MKCHLADWPSQQVESLAPNHSGTWWRNLWPHLRALKDSGCSWWKHCRVGSRQKQSRVSCRKRGKCGLVKRLKDSWAGAIMFGSAYLGRDDRNDRSVRGRMRWWDDIRKGKPLDNLPRGVKNPKRLHIIAQQVIVLRGYLHRLLGDFQTWRTQRCQLWPWAIVRGKSRWRCWAQWEIQMQKRR